MDEGFPHVIDTLDMGDVIIDRWSDSSLSISDGTPSNAWSGELSGDQVRRLVSWLISPQEVA